MNQIYSVEINGKPYSEKFQVNSEFANGWKSVLLKAHGNYAFCLCPGHGERQLAIKRRVNTDEFHLAKYPHTGHEHHETCRFYAVSPEQSGLQAYAKDVVEELDDGTVQICLARGIQQKSPTHKKQTSPLPSRRPQSSKTYKPSMGLLGMLHLLWERANLNQWYPKMKGKRYTSNVFYFIRQTAAEIRVGSIFLHDVLLLPAEKESTQAQRNRDIVAYVKTNNFRPIIIAPLAVFNTQKHTVMETLPLSLPFGLPRLNLPADIYERVQKRFTRELQAWKEGEKVIAIAQMNTPPTEIIDIALMHVSTRWIPLDSSYEGRMETLLYEHDRAFYKPLRYDADEDVFFPDFKLLGIGREFPIEVFGMTTPEYLAQKEKKTAWYNEKYGETGWWYWDAVADPHMQQCTSLPSA